MLKVLSDPKLSDTELYRMVRDAAEHAGKLKGFLAEFGTEKEYLRRVSGQEA